MPFKFIKILENSKGIKFAIYQSFSEDLTTMTKPDFSDLFFSVEYDTKEYISNIGLDKVLTLSEVCMMINSDKYLNGTITLEEVNEIVQEFLNQYQIEEDEDDDEKIVIVKKKQSKRTRQK